MRTESTAKRKAIRALLIWALLLFTLLAGTAFASEDDPENDLDPPNEADAFYEEAADITPWHTHTMLPGETYDVGTAEKNTTVYISEAGTYYLKGKSTHCRIVIKSGGVDLYLKDGLHIDPNAYAYVGSSTAAITVEDQGGEVRLISEKEASIYLGGYYYCPAIRKDGHVTKLTFETVDPSAPGTITAYRSMISHSAAIGSVYRLIADNGYTGNMEFKSGKIIASGGKDAAGIGCGSGAFKAVGLVFSGADVTATGYGYGAGIGGGLSGAVDKITISGGKVVANGDRGAGIGGGMTTNTKSGRCGTITITGGDITATSQFASGIGCGLEASIEHIVISGGKVRAVCKTHGGTGIGGTGSNFYGRCAQIDISGGTVYAEGGPDSGVGIGSALCGEEGTTTINISGGYVEAVAGQNGVSIGGGGKGAIQNTGHCYVNISGGTVRCLPVTDGCISSRYDLTCIITGGSILCGAPDIKGTPKDANGNQVTLMNVDLYGCPKGSAVSEASITEPSTGYGMNDVITMDGEEGSFSVVYPWLPINTETNQMTAAGVRYYGNAQTRAGAGMLYPAAGIELNADCSDEGAQGGTAFGLNGEGIARDITHALRPGYTLVGYVPMRSSRKIVLYPDGSFGKDVTGYTDADGKWIFTGNSITFYALWQNNTCTVHFNGNVPSSTSSVLSGTMEDQTFARGTEPTLRQNAFRLPGYTFSGWNTSPDGTGTPAADQAPAAPLVPADSGTVTLYAQWSPVTYTVTVTNDGYGTASANPGSGTTDTPVKLTATPADGYAFDQWEVVSGSVTVEGNQFTIGTDDVEIKACFKAMIPPVAVLTGISISRAPNKTTYAEGETFDKTGMIVTAAYSDDSSKAVTGYEIIPSGALSVTDTTVEISYTENGVTKTVSLTIQVKPAGPNVYKIIIGMNQMVYTNVKSAKFASDADFNKFDHVEVDGKTVEKKYYTAASGSTEVTFNQDFIKTLSVGTHRLTIVSTDGSASTEFTVRKPVPPTGDSTDPALLALLMLISVSMIVLVSVKAKKRES